MTKESCSAKRFKCRQRPARFTRSPVSPGTRDPPHLVARRRIFALPVAGAPLAGAGVGAGDGERGGKGASVAQGTVGPVASHLHGRGRAVLSLKVRRVFLARHRVDFRKQFDGLLAEAFQLGADPYDGDCVLFVNQIADCNASARHLLRPGRPATVAQERVAPLPLFGPTERKGVAYAKHLKRPRCR